MENLHFYLITPLAYTGATSAFTYRSSDALTPGQIVEIPIGRRTVTGIIEREVEQPSFPTKAVTTILDLPSLPIDLISLANWMTNYYAASPSSVWTTFLPAGLTRTRRPTKAAHSGDSPSLSLPPLTTEQTAALNYIRANNIPTTLLQGVTGSGKTRLYLELTADALAAQRSVIILVPEITLTPQIIAQFEALFGNQVLASHSKLTEAQRHHIWNEAVASMSRQQPRIIIGPRSCLFMPVHQLGLVIIDECHETSYKQDQHPRYHAILTAATRTRLTGARLVLGSATPGLNELYIAQQGRIEHIFLTQRANKLSHPKAKIIDMRDKSIFKLSKFITQPLIEAVQETIVAGRQALLYLNRRGSASSQICADCGNVTLCPHCQLPLTFHADLMRLICHHCNYRVHAPAVCPECHGASLRLLGGGTKRVEAELAQIFPTARIARLDRDSATLAHIKSVYRGLRDGEIDLLVGTQMVAKGLDLPRLDTVGVINADTMLHLPDFTAAERTYQLLNQVAGRAGRGDRPGQVFIQTYTPDHPAIQAAAANDYERFAHTELDERRHLNYPPFVYLLKLTLVAPTREEAQRETMRYATHLRHQTGIVIVGPAPAFIELQANKYHWIITVKSKRRPPLVAIANSLPSAHWTADLDPANLL